LLFLAVSITAVNKQFQFFKDLGSWLLALGCAIFVCLYIIKTKRKMKTNAYEFYAIFILLLLITVEYLTLLPCQFQHILESSVVVKHVFGLFTMLFLVIIAEGDETLNVEHALKQCVPLYAGFVLMTKTNAYVFMLLAALLGCAYLLSLKKKDLEHENKGAAPPARDTARDEAHAPPAKDGLQQIQTIETIIDYLYKAFFVFTILGVTLYLGEKKIEYKNKFSYITFIFGKMSCKHASPNVPFLQALKSAFQ